MKRYCHRDGTFHHIGKTEAMKNDENPKFKTQMIMDYTFESKQTMHFLVIETDDGKPVSTMLLQYAHIRGQSCVFHCIVCHIVFLHGYIQ